MVAIRTAKVSTFVVACVAFGCTAVDVRAQEITKGFNPPTYVTPEEALRLAIEQLNRRPVQPVKPPVQQPYTPNYVPTPPAGPANLAGAWIGTSHYPAHATQYKPFSYHVALVHEGQKISGTIKEPNTFGPDQGQAWLHSIVLGSFDARSRKVTFVKKYTGAGGVEHALIYNGVFAANGAITGRWSSPDNPEWGGMFEFRRAAVNNQQPDTLLVTAKPAGIKPADAKVADPKQPHAQQGLSPFPGYGGGLREPVVQVVEPRPSGLTPAKLKVIEKEQQSNPIAAP